MAVGTCKSGTIRVVHTGLLVLSGVSGLLQAQSPPSIDPAKAAAAFTEAQQLSTKDNGRLWGKTLNGPTLFVLPATRAVAANEPDAGGILHQQGSIYVGSLPKDVVIGNTAVDWAGFDGSAFVCDRGG